jgi:hypothetical protein
VNIEERASATHADPQLRKGVVPQYDFLCQSCKTLFSRTLTLPEYEHTVIYRPHCGTDDVEQGRWIAFHSVPDKKSA